MIDFKPTSYSISIQEKEIEGETFFVAMVAEFPDAKVYEDCPAKAYTAMIEVIDGLKAAFKKHNKVLPTPGAAINSEASGRVTLRMPRSLHGTIDRQAQREAVSLNQHIVYLISDASARLEAKSESPKVSVQPSRYGTLTKVAGHVYALKAQVIAKGLREGQLEVIKRMNLTFTAHDDLELSEDDNLAVVTHRSAGANYAIN